MADSSLSSAGAAPAPLDSAARLLASPPPRAPSQPGKERRQPSITPRKFRRFFTPRVSAKPTAARRALRDLTARALNRPLGEAPSSGSTPQPWLSPSPLAAHFEKEPASPADADADALLPPSRPAKRRKTGHQTPETSPLRPCSAVFLGAITPDPAARKAAVAMLLSPLASSPLPAIVDEPMSEAEAEAEAEADAEGRGEEADDAAMSDTAEPAQPFARPPLKKTVTLAARGLAGQFLQREFGAVAGAGHRQLSRPVGDWRMETAGFYSTPDDSYYCTSSDPAGVCIPFCAAACNTNGLVAIGDEEGRVRILDSSPQCAEGFNSVYLSFPAHGNAVIDLAFSGDDHLLATASGDQTGKVLDMMTQAPVAVLDHHTASLKQVRFQPGKGDGNVLATSSRDGSIKIWDLRCRGGPVQDVVVERPPEGLHYGHARDVKEGCVVNSFYGAHARATRPTRQMRKLMQAAVAADVTTRWEEPGRVGEVSVTALAFLPAGREHLILSACEADASIKLWDIRNIHTSRQKTSTPVSFTAPPESHTQWRPFGMSSLSLSTDGARLYGVCKDNTVYAYSTSHLVLGTAPELAPKAGDLPRRRNGVAQEGLGPLYGFRHDRFHAASFYVKSAVRPACDGRPELLAVGSSDGCAVLFPTDERYLAARGAEPASTPPIFTTAAAAAANHSSGSSMQGGGVRLVDTVPIARAGTALVRGHEEKEVGAVCWTDAGSLVTVCDDHTIRCWRDDDNGRGKAADLRTGGEHEGRRWMAGWAEAGAGWDEDAEDAEEAWDAWTDEA